MVAVPSATPVTTPLADATVATDVLLLLHVPPGVLLLRVVVVNAQRVSVPVMDGGALLTVTTSVAWQPVLIS